MVNYYKQFEKVVEQQHLKGKQVSLIEFEQLLRCTFGFGTSKTTSRWVTNFVNAKLVTIKKNKDNEWIVTFIKGGVINSS